MSDAGRKPITDQVSEKITPDSQKSTLDRASETVSGHADKVAASLQPGDSKSTAQKLSDTARSHGDLAQDKGKDIYNQASGAASDVSKDVADSSGSTLSNIQKQAEGLYNQAHQKLSEVTSGGDGQGKTLYEQASDVATNALNTVSKLANDAANSISGSGENKK